MLSKGEMAPDFELLASDGTSVTLSQLRGRRVVLFFYPKAGTSGCTKQACGFRDSFPKIEAADATVVGVSPDKPAALAKWKRKESLPYLLLSDPDHVVADAYGTWGEKSLYGRKYMGIIRSHFIIDSDGRLEDVQYKINPEQSVAEALRTLQGAA